MKKILTIVVILSSAILNHAKAQDQSIMVNAGAGIIGPACTNCGLLGGVQSTVEYGVLDKITVGGNFNYYFDKDEFFGTQIKETVMYVGGKGSFYLKERFRGFYLSADFGFISYKTDWAGQISKQNNFTVGGSMGWTINIADVIIVNPHMGYGSWFDNSKGRVEMGLRIGAKF